MSRWRGAAAILITLAVLAGAAIGATDVPRSAIDLYRSESSDFLRGALLLEQQGLADCERSGLAVNGTSDNRLSLTCDIRGLAWRHATVWFVYYACDDGVVLIDTRGINGLYRSAVSGFPIVAQQCPEEILRRRRLLDAWAEEAERQNQDPLRSPLKQE